MGIAAECQRMRWIEQHIEKLDRAWWSYIADKLLCRLDSPELEKIETANWVAYPKN